MKKTINLVFFLFFVLLLLSSNNVEAASKASFKKMIKNYNEDIAKFNKINYFNIDNTDSINSNISNYNISNNNDLNLLNEFKNVLNKWEHFDYVKFPKYSDNINSNVESQIFSLILEKAQLNDLSYPHLTNFFMDVLKNTKNTQKKFFAYSVLAFAAEDMVYYEEAINFYTNALNVIIHINDKEAKEVKCLYINYVVTLLAKLLLEDEILKLERYILEAQDKRIPSKYYSDLCFMYLELRDFDKVNNTIEKIKKYDGNYQKYVSLIDLYKKTEAKTKEMAYEAYKYNQKDRKYRNEKSALSHYFVRAYFYLNEQ